MYRVEIYEVTEQEQVTSSYEKVCDMGNTRDGGAQYEYVVSPVPKKTLVEKSVFTQMVEDLDLKAVIWAVNRMGK